MVLLVIVVSCTWESKSSYKLSDDDFEKMLFDVELAREASKTGEFNEHDSLFDLYLKAVAIRYNLDTADVQLEIKMRLAESSEFASVYDKLRERVDSLNSNNSLLRKELVNEK